MSNQNVWCVASIPTKPWADKVFPEAGDNAEDKLWDAIFRSVRVDQEDPVQAWKDHQNNLNKRLDFLNGHKFIELRYKNSIGTDLKAKLPKGHIWLGGGDKSTSGQEFIPNMPTEEVFTMPKRDGVNGKIVSSLPLNVNGNVIKDFSFTLKDGVIIDHNAKKGFDTLTELLNTDDGARRLGEVALVPYDSPISNQKILFYNTLFDENASCHFALGKAYPTCVEGGENKNPDELLLAGANDSLIHEDFMIGTDDLEITGIKTDGSEVKIFSGGNFANN